MSTLYFPLLKNTTEIVNNKLNSNNWNPYTTKAKQRCSATVFVLDLSGGCPDEGDECNNWKVTKSFVKEMIAIDWIIRMSRGIGL